MKETILFDQGYEWIYFGRDLDKPEKIIDTNQYLIKDGNRCLLLDPGGIETFSSMLASITRHVRLEDISDLFASHQDPDIISSLRLWDKALPHTRLHAPWLWEGFIRHFGCNNIEYVGIPDDGGVLQLNRAKIHFIPAHYLHSSGNFHIYDPKAKLLMSGDVGAALEPIDSGIFVEDFSEHTKKMTLFHQRWMPSNKAKNDWISRVRELDIEMMAPQHGRIFKGEDVKRFLDWFEELDVGIAIKPFDKEEAA
jgi:flavorubredoxin